MLSRSPSPTSATSTSQASSPTQRSTLLRQEKPPAYQSSKTNTEPSSSYEGQKDRDKKSLGSSMDFAAQRIMSPQDGTWQHLQALSDRLPALTQRQRIRHEAISLVASLEIDALNMLRRDGAEAYITPHYDVIVEVSRKNELPMQNLPSRLLEKHTALWWAVEKTHIFLLNILLQCQPSRRVRQEACERFSVQEWTAGEQLWRAAFPKDVPLLNKNLVDGKVRRAEDWVGEKFGSISAVVEKIHYSSTHISETDLCQLHEYLSDDRADNTIIEEWRISQSEWPTIANNFEFLVSQLSSLELRRLVRIYTNVDYPACVESTGEVFQSLQFLLPLLLSRMSNQAADDFFVAFLENQQDHRVTIKTAVDLHVYGAVWKTTSFPEVCRADPPRNCMPKKFYNTEMRELAVQLRLSSAVKWLDSQPSR